MADLKRGSVSANGIRFHYLEMRDGEMGDGPLVLCMHGFPDSAHSFDFLLPELAAAGFRAVAPFMRGYSPTEPPQDGRYQTALLSQDVVELVGALGFQQAVLVGHDWGAWAVLGAAVLAPEKITRLVTLASAHPAAGERRNYSSLKGSWHAFYFQLADAEATVAHDDFAFIEEWWRDTSPEWDIPRGALEEGEAHLPPARSGAGSPGLLPPQLQPVPAGPSTGTDSGPAGLGPSTRSHPGPSWDQGPATAAGSLRGHGQLLHRRTPEGRRARNRPLHAPGEALGGEPPGRGVPEDLMGVCPTISWSRGHWRSLEP